MTQCFQQASDFVGEPARLEAAFTQSCFSNANQEATQAVENHAEGPDISLSLLDTESQHTVPSPNADRYACLHALHWTICEQT